MDERARTAVIEFLNRCIDYADASIARKQQRRDDAQEIERWQTYREFTAHAVEEVESGQLDDWFEADPQSVEALTSAGQMSAIDPSALGREERAFLLAATVTPRPLVLAATRSALGVENIASVSSISVLSTTPPLISLSLSADRNGRPRDTLLNLEEEPNITLMVLTAEHDSARLVEMAARPLPRDESEWQQLAAPPEMTCGLGHPLPDLVLAALECRCVELLELPEGAVSRLAILHVDRILTRDSAGVPLAQHGLDRVGPAWLSRGWSRIIEW